MKYTLRTELFPLTIIALSFAISGFFYAHFPERVATHWNFQGVADGFSGRAFGAWFVPVLMLVMYIMFVFLPYLDPKRERYASFEKVYRRLKSIFMLLFFVLMIVTGLSNLGYPIQMNIYIPLAVGTMFIVLGNYMGKVKQNWFVGFKFPWTLSSENVWNKTHRFGGWAMIVAGLTIMISPLFPQNIGILIFLFGILLMTIGTMIYSYLIFRNETKRT